MSTFKTLFMGVGFCGYRYPLNLFIKQQSSLTQSGLNPADFDSTVLGKKTELVTLKNALTAWKFASPIMVDVSFPFPFQTRTESQQMWFLVTIISIGMLTP